MKKYLMIATILLVSSTAFGQDKPKTEPANPATVQKMPAAVNAQNKTLRDLAEKKRLEIEKATAELRAAQSEAREVDRALQDVFKEGLKQLGITEEQLASYDVKLEKDEIVLLPKSIPANTTPPKKENGG
jgi:hypothetical protein